MPRFGYALSCEEHPPAALVRHARVAEEPGFDFAMVSDHYHPWTDRQGNSSFVWSVIGAIAQTTERISLGTGVTCPRAFLGTDRIGEVPVYNVSVPVMERDFWRFELSGVKHAGAAVH